MDELELKERLNWYENKYGPYIKSKGIHNWKNLFKKPTYNDWVILFMLVMALFIAWSYQHDVSICREYIKQQQDNFGTSNIKSNNLMSDSGLIEVKKEIGYNNT